MDPIQGLTGPCYDRYPIQFQMNLRKVLFNMDNTQFIKVWDIAIRVFHLMESPAGSYDWKLILIKKKDQLIFESSHLDNKYSDRFVYHLKTPKQQF